MFFSKLIIVRDLIMFYELCFHTYEKIGTEENYFFSLKHFVYSGVSANADPHTYKLRIRVVHIWDYRRRQLNRSAMEEPRPGGTTLMIMVNLLAR